MKTTPSKQAIKTPSAKKSSKKSSLKSPKRPFGEVRKTNIDKVSKNLQEALNKTKISSVDNIVPQILGICEFNFSVLKELTKKVQKSHLSNKMVEEMFFQSMCFQNEAKYLLRRTMLKSSTTSEPKVEYLQHLYKIQDPCNTKLKPEKVRSYNRKPTKVIKNPEKEVTKLNVKINDQKNILKGMKKGIDKKEIEVNTSKTKYFSAIKAYRTNHPMDDDIEDPKDYELLVNKETNLEHTTWLAHKTSLASKEKEYEVQERKVATMDSKYQKAQHEVNRLSMGHGDDSSSDEEEEEDDNQQHESSSSDTDNDVASDTDNDVASDDDIVETDNTHMQD